MKIQNINKVLLITVMFIVVAFSTKAQLNPFQSMYFQNKYIYNPSMAGVEQGLNINTTYRQQWTSFPGTPKTGLITADFQPTARVGVGVNINDEQAGLIRQTHVMGTYAYHLPVSETGKLHFGISLGFDDSRLNYAAVNGDVSDAEIAQYNQLKAYVDGDFGIAYTTNDLYIGSAFPSLKSAFFNSSDPRFGSDRLMFVTIASYKLSLRGEDRSYLLEPLLGYRIVKGHTDIFDIGAKFDLTKRGLFIQSVYHTSESLVVGFGIDQNYFAASFNYNIETGALSNYTRGGFELGVKIKLFRPTIK